MSRSECSLISEKCRAYEKQATVALGELDSSRLGGVLSWPLLGAADSRRRSFMQCMHCAGSSFHFSARFSVKAFPAP